MNLAIHHFVRRRILEKAIHSSINKNRSSYSINFELPLDCETKEIHDILESEPTLLSCWRVTFIYRGGLKTGHFKEVKGMVYTPNYSRDRFINAFHEPGTLVLKFIARD